MPRKEALSLAIHIVWRLALCCSRQGTKGVERGVAVPLVAAGNSALNTRLKIAKFKADYFNSITCSYRKLSG
jgi:hypothetical protein